MYDFAFKNCLIAINPNLKTDIEPLQHLLPPQIPFQNQFRKYIQQQEKQQYKNVSMIHHHTKNSGSFFDSLDISNNIKYQRERRQSPYSQNSFQLKSNQKSKSKEKSQSQLQSQSKSKSKSKQRLDLNDTHPKRSPNRNLQLTSTTRIAQLQLQQLYQTKIQKLQRIIKQKDTTIGNLSIHLQKIQQQLRQCIQIKNIYQINNISLQQKLRTNQLMFINNQKKYEQIIKVYEQQTLKLKQSINMNTNSNQRGISNWQIEKQNKILLARIKKLQKDLMDKQKQLVFKTRVYQEKNQDSRKLLEKLNDNITKNQQKLNYQLEESKKQIQKLNKQLLKFKQQNQQNKKNQQILQDKIIKVEESRVLHQSKSTKLIQTYQSKIKRLQERQAEIIKIKEQQKKELELIIVGLKQQLTLNRQESSSQLQQIQKFKQDRRNQESILIQTQEKFIKVEEILDRLEYQKKLLQGNVQVMRVDLQNYQVKVQQLEQEKRQIFYQKECLKKEIDHCDKKNSQQIKEIQSLRISCKQKEITYNAKVQENRALEQKNRNHLQTISSLQLNKNSLLLQIQSQKKQVKQYESQLRFLQQKIKQISIKYQKSQKLLDLYKTQSKKMKSNTQTKWIQLKQVYQQQLDTMQKKLKEYQTKIKDLKKSNLQTVSMLNNNSNSNSNCKICSSFPSSNYIIKKDQRINLLQLGLSTVPQFYNFSQKSTKKQKSNQKSQSKQKNSINANVPSYQVHYDHFKENNQSNNHIDQQSNSL